MTEQELSITSEQQVARAAPLIEQKAIRMSELPSEIRNRILMYSFIAGQIVILAFGGWFIGPYFFPVDGDIFGMLLGTMLGTFLMFIALFYLAFASDS